MMYQLIGLALLGLAALLTADDPQSRITKAPEPAAKPKRQPPPKKAPEPVEETEEEWEPEWEEESGNPDTADDSGVSTDSQVEETGDDGH